MEKWNDIAESVGYFLVLMTLTVPFKKIVQLITSYSFVLGSFSGFRVQLTSPQQFQVFWWWRHYIYLTGIKALSINIVTMTTCSYLIFILFNPTVGGSVLLKNKSFFISKEGFQQICNYDKKWVMY